MARGWAPGKIARHMRDVLGVAPRTAMLSARTETLRVYREASLAQYRQSGIVDGYIRVAAKSERTCMACLAMDGEWFPLSEPFAEHPAGRCRSIPAKQGQQYPGTQGLDWFLKQPESRQRLMLGPGRYEAWKANKFDLADIAKLHKDPTWGNAWQERSLKDLLTLPKRPAGALPVAPGAIDVGKLELGKFASLEEAQAWGRATYPHIDWDFKGAHIDTINPTLVQFDKLAREFPEVAKRLEYIGTRQVKRPFYWLESKIAHAADGKIIGLNPFYYGNPDDLRAILNIAVDSRYLPRGCDTIESVLTHEFGHLVGTWLRSSDQAFIPYVRDDGFGLVRQAVADFLQHTTSRQRKALGNRAEVPGETWALAFSSLYHTQTRGQGVLVRNMATLLKTLMSRRWINRLDIDPTEISAQEVTDIYTLLEKIGAVPL
jgi:SPP1 gp7 family putative phage head morphogenesis protein